MLRLLALLTIVGLTTAGLVGCGAVPLEGACGRMRSVTVHEAGPGLTVDLSLSDDEKQPDGISWEVVPRGIQGVTAVHLHDGLPGHGNRLLYDLTSEDTYLDDGFSVAGSQDYSYNGEIDNLFTLVRTGSTYIDVHTGSAEPALRIDLTDVQFQNWSDYYCS